MEIARCPCILRTARRTRWVNKKRKNIGGSLILRQYLKFGFPGDRRKKYLQMFLKKICESVEPVQEYNRRISI